MLHLKDNQHTVYWVSCSQKKQQKHIIDLCLYFACHPSGRQIWPVKDILWYFLWHKDCQCPADNQYDSSLKKKENTMMYSISVLSPQHHQHLQ